MRDQPQVSSHYRGAKGEAYLANRLSDHAGDLGYRFILNDFLPYLNPSDTVLDFGAGNGSVLRLLKEQVSCAEGLEVNPAAAAVARQVSACRVYESIDELLPGTAYDAIITNHVLEHVRDVCGTLERLRLHLKPGGLLIARLPIDDIGDRHQRGWSADDVDHHLQTWTPRLFANVCFESGYEVRECRILTAAYDPRLFALRRIGLARPAFWLFAVIMHRRQILAVARRPREGAE